MSGWNRRVALAGLGALAASPGFCEDRKPSPIAHGVLADNILAKTFQPPDETELPYVNVWGPNGRRSLDTLKGRTILMPIWAEWCAPCMSELPDFSRLQEKYGNDEFAIIPILSGTQKKFTPEALATVFKLAHCGVFEPLIENNLEDRLARVMARRRDTYALPCNLLVAPDGRVIARQIGALGNSDDAAPAKTYNETLNRMGAGDVQSRWGQADGEEFAKAMAAGFLA